MRDSYHKSYLSRNMKVKVYCDECEGGRIKDCPECGGAGYTYKTYCEVSEMDRLKVEIQKLRDNLKKVIYENRRRFQ